MPTSKPAPKVPAPLANAMAAVPAARDAWKALAPSHRREYSEWIASAKRAETLERRVTQAVAMLVGGRKTPMRANDAPPVSAAPIASKLGAKPGRRVVVLAAPKGYEDRIPGAATKGKGEVVLAFAQDSKALAKVLPKVFAAATEGALVWVAFPKKTSGVATDLSRDRGWEVLDQAGWEGVSIVAIDAVWSAARLRRA